MTFAVAHAIHGSTRALALVPPAAVQHVHAHNVRIYVRVPVMDSED